MTIVVTLNRQEIGAAIAQYVEAKFPQSAKPPLVKLQSDLEYTALWATVEIETQ